ncbi:MAG: hypothetical protein HY678_10185, partial [Chloroflexi bacterium]|nr:hypothetical protein [Chloroflexota bacterium]
GELTVYDTATLRILHQEPVDGPAFLLGGNPISLSGDGRWLVVAHHPQPDGGGRLVSVFDTRTVAFLSGVPPGLFDCTSPWLAPRLAGRPVHAQLYALCNDAVVALDARTLVKWWQAKTHPARGADLVLSPDGAYLYAMHPQIDVRCCRGSSVYVEETNLFLSVWDTETGRLNSEVNLGELVHVPDATIGRGDGAYLAISPDGRRLYVLWEDRLWDVDAATVQASGAGKVAIREVALPAPADGMTINSDGRELYILPATAGDLPRRGRGMWTVDAARLAIERQTPDWPDLPSMALLYSAHAPGTANASSTPEGSNSPPSNGEECPVSPPVARENIPDHIANAILAGSSQPDRTQISVYGHDLLWITFPPDGIVRGVSRDGGVFEKFLFFPSTWKGVPSFLGRRLDDPTIRAHFGISSGWTSGGSFWVVGASFPATGCWEVTARLQDDELQFIVEVSGESGGAW